MRVFLTISTLAGILISGGIAVAGPMETAPPPVVAPNIVPIQPRDEHFRPHSPADRAEQRRLSRFDARRTKR